MKKEYFKNQRLLHLQNSMNHKKISALLVSNPVNIAYLTASEGIINLEREVFLLITLEKNILFKSTLVDVENIDNFQIYAFNNMNELYKLINKSLKQKELERLHFESKNLKVFELENLKKQIKTKFIATTNIVEDLRIIKDDAEIADIEESCRITTLTYKKAKSWMRLGISEIELAEKIKEQLIKFGSQGSPKSFSPIVAFGQNSAIPHHQPGKRKLNSQDIVLIDFGCLFNGYCSDFSRTIKLGNQTSEFLIVKNSVIKAYKLAVRLVKKGIKINLLDKEIKILLSKEGFNNKMLHSIGHGIGLEIHEKPSISAYSKNNNSFKKGMTIALEPAIYLSGKFGYRYENSILITTNGVKELTISK